MPTTNYIYHGNQYLCETDENDTPTKMYVNEPGTYTKLVSQKNLSTGEKSYPLYDAVGSTRAVTDENGDVTDTFVYDAWGNVLDRTGATDIPFQYVGQYGYYRDEETEINYVMARTYNPLIIRWLSVDPAIIHESQMHEYIYSDNSSVLYNDPTGMKTNWYVKGVAKSFINGLPRIGTITPPGRKGGFFPSWLSWPFGVGGGIEDALQKRTTATQRLHILSKSILKLRQPAFFQFPTTDAKDGEYRLYTMLDVSFCCDEKAGITLSGYKRDMEGGYELKSAGIYGTINMRQTVVNHGDKIIVWWKGWGRPNAILEPAMSWVAFRTSVNIWHTARLELKCDGEKGSYKISFFKHSKFPSHQLWINGVLERDYVQADYSELWNPLPLDNTFVVE